MTDICGFLKLIEQFSSFFLPFMLQITPRRCIMIQSFIEIAMPITRTYPTPIPVTCMITEKVFPYATILDLDMEQEIHIMIHTR